MAGDFSLFILVRSKANSVSASDGGLVDRNWLHAFNPFRRDWVGTDRTFTHVAHRLLSDSFLNTDAYCDDARNRSIGPNG